MKIAVILIATLLVVLGGGAGGLYAYDSSREGLIAEGITVAGVDVSGLTVEEAGAAVREQVVRRLRKPLVLAHEGRNLRLVSARELRVRVDVDAMVENALRASREGDFLTRTLHELTGDGLDLDVPLRVTYSSQAVSKLVSRLRQDLDRPAKNARVSTSPTALRLTRSEDGLEVRADRLRRAIVSHVVAPDSDRTVEVPTTVVRPRTTTADMRARYKSFVAVSRDRFELRLFEDFRLVKTYPVSIGRIGYETPSGLYRIKNKVENPAWYVPNKPWAGSLAGEVIPPGPDNPIKARWMGFYDGAGIHGTDDVGSIGSPASHGCVRMLIPDVVELAGRVPVGSPLYIG